MASNTDRCGCSSCMGWRQHKYIMRMQGVVTNGPAYRKYNIAFPSFKNDKTERLLDENTQLYDRVRMDPINKHLYAHQISENLKIYNKILKELKRDWQQTVANAKVTHAIVLKQQQEERERQEREKQENARKHREGFVRQMDITNKLMSLIAKITGSANNETALIKLLENEAEIRQLCDSTISN